jgi:hypothetical protein
MVKVRHCQNIIPTSLIVDVFLLHALDTSIVISNNMRELQFVFLTLNQVWNTSICLAYDPSLKNHGTIWIQKISYHLKLFLIDIRLREEKLPNVFQTS